MRFNQLHFGDYEFKVGEWVHCEYREKRGYILDIAEFQDGEGDFVGYKIKILHVNHENFKTFQRWSDIEDCKPIPNEFKPFGHKDLIDEALRTKDYVWFNELTNPNRILNNLNQ